MQNYSLFSDEIHKKGVKEAAIEWKKAIADILSENISLYDEDPLMPLIKLAEAIDNLSDDDIISLLNEKLTE